MNVLEKRVIDISYRHQLTHISSCLNCVNLIAWIYDQKKPDDIFILGNGHAGLALYVVLESKGFCDAEEMVTKHGVHPSRDRENGIWCSSGSLGQAETVAVGMALADPKRKVWLVTSDGACMEGSVYESFRVAAKHCPNLQIHVIFNGLGAYGEISINQMPSGITVTGVDQRHYPPWLRGLQGHYLKLDQEQYEELMS